MWSPIILQDPKGFKFILPYERCRTWLDFQATLHKLYKNGRWPQVSSNFQPSLDDPNCQYYDIIMDVGITTEFWDQSLRPGMHIGVDTSSCKFPVAEEAPSVNPADESGSATTVENSGMEIEQDELKHAITYTVDVRQMSEKDDTETPLVHRQIAEMPTFKRFQWDPSDTRDQQAVLQEIFRFSRSHKKSKVPFGMEASTFEYDDDDHIWRPTLHIHSKILLNALRVTIKFEHKKHPSENPTAGLEAGFFEFPYSDLYYNLTRIVGYKNSDHPSRTLHDDDYNQKCDEQIDLLEEFLTNHPLTGFKTMQANMAKPIPVTTYKDLWLLFRPGESVYVQEAGGINMYIVKTISAPDFVDGKISSNNDFTLKLWNLDWNGEDMNPAHDSVTIRKFTEEFRIGKLECYPCRFHSDTEGEKPLREQLIERGEKFVKLVKNGSTYQQYTGTRWLQRSEKLHYGRVIVDHKLKPWIDVMSHYAPNATETAGKYIRASQCGCLRCKTENPEISHSSEDEFMEYNHISNRSENMNERLLMLCSWKVWVYVLAERKWDVVSVAGLTDPDIDPGVIEKLVLRVPSTIEMIKGLCEQYTERDSDDPVFFADVIQGKGEGNILLLHGPPGTGKTLTAECVAEYTGRPLLNIAAADLGYKADELEKNLLKFFHNATKWNAIVLLDEADVYLERRSTMDLERNSVVSVFLRALDYFKGLLFLTTNRTGTFDDAFTSRIHVKIQYEALDRSTRQQIWQNGWDKLMAYREKNDREIQWTYEAKEYVRKSQDLEALEWNGREIRNAIQTAVGLATYDAKKAKSQIPTVTEKHIIMIVEMSRQFKTYMHKTLKATPAELASAQKLRYDKLDRQKLGTGT